MHVTLRNCGGGCIAWSDSEAVVLFASENCRIYVVRFIIHPFGSKLDGREKGGRGGLEGDTYQSYYMRVGYSSSVASLANMFSFFSHYFTRISTDCTHLPKYLTYAAKREVKFKQRNQSNV